MSKFTSFRSRLATAITASTAILAILFLCTLMIFELRVVMAVVTSGCNVTRRGVYASKPRVKKRGVYSESGGGWEEGESEPAGGKAKKRNELFR